MKKNEKTSTIWNIGNYFWGLLFILIGGLALASSLGYLTMDWSNLWRLWPVYVVGIGLSLVRPQNWLWKTVSLAVFVSTLLVSTALLLGLFNIVSNLRTQEITIPKISDEVRQVDVTVRSGMSSLVIKGSDQDDVIRSRFESNIATINSNYSLSGDTQIVELGMDNQFSGRWWGGDIRNVWGVDLINGIPMSINLETGATNMDIDVSRLNIRNLNVKTGASSLDIKMGDLESLSTITIESGVSSIKIKTPKSSGVQLRVDGALLSTDLGVLEKLEEGLYRTPGYLESDKKVEIVAKIGVSSFVIERI